MTERQPAEIVLWGSRKKKKVDQRRKECRQEHPESRLNSGHSTRFRQSGFRPSLVCLREKSEIEREKDKVE